MGQRIKSILVRCPVANPVIYVLAPDTWIFILEFQSLHHDAVMSVLLFSWVPQLGVCANDKESDRQRQGPQTLYCLLPMRGESVEETKDNVKGELRQFLGPLLLSPQAFRITLGSPTVSPHQDCLETGGLIPVPSSWPTPKSALWPVPFLPAGLLAHFMVNSLEFQ